MVTDVFQNVRGGDMQERTVNFPFRCIQGSAVDRKPGPGKYASETAQAGPPQEPHQDGFNLVVLMVSKKKVGYGFLIHDTGDFPVPEDAGIFFEIRAVFLQMDPTDLEVDLMIPAVVFDELLIEFRVLVPELMIDVNSGKWLLDG